MKYIHNEGLTADKLKLGERAKIRNFGDLMIQRKLAAMGVLIGQEVCIIQRTIMGASYYTQIGGQFFALRREELQAIEVENVPS